MFVFLIWAMLASALFTIAKASTEGPDVSPARAGITWTLAAVAFFGAFAYCDPMAKEQQEAAAPSVSAADRSLLGSAMMACDERTRRSVNIPRTLDFKTFQTTRQVLPGRVARIFRGFSAENAFGQTLDFTYYCEYRAGEIQAYSISRR